MKSSSMPLPGTKSNVFVSSLDMGPEGNEVVATASTGSSSFTPFFSAAARISFAISIISSSHKEVPMLMPFALENVYARPPPKTKI
ncbi:unnamed protein product [Pseudo-nitzschia multistriata]|uniref:Uncharacterized protein n=1 Tax=Pseudo-nitzschia multistriata TaxID=183589 RepID=A0A448Z2Y0_9STRA|nr:unnamed protein product [Pseudo-nitzschia multistriata]